MLLRLLPLLLLLCACACQTEPPCICTEEYEPVCAADGNTYGNRCEAERCANALVACAGPCPCFSEEVIRNCCSSKDKYCCEGPHADGTPDHRICRLAKIDCCDYPVEKECPDDGDGDGGSGGC